MWDFVFHIHSCLLDCLSLNSDPCGLVMQQLFLLEIHKKAVVDKSNWGAKYLRIRFVCCLSHKEEF